MTYNPCPTLCVKMEKSLKRNLKVDNKIIYHYTSSQSLLNILKNNVLWFTDINFLNDELEGKYFIDLVIKYLLESGSTYESAFTGRLIEILTTILETKYECTLGAYTMLNMNNYVASFSFQQDSLNLWNYYTKSDSLTGYNIAFSMEKFNKSINTEIIAGKVIYDVAIIFEILGAVITPFYKEYLKYPGEDSLTAGYFTLCELALLLVKFRLFFKHPSFSNEQEYRIVIAGQNNTEYRERKGIIIPYIEQHFSKNSVLGITISPTQKQELTKMGVELFTKEYNYNNLYYNFSSIPLRY